MPGPDDTGHYWLPCGDGRGAAFATRDRAQLAYTNWLGMAYVFDVAISDMYDGDGNVIGQSYLQTQAC